MNLAIEKAIAGQLLALAVAQSLLWQQEEPAGAAKEAVLYSLVYALLEVPLSAKITPFSLGVLEVKINYLKDQFKLPSDAEELRTFIKNFKLTIEEQEFSFSEGVEINEILKMRGSNYRLSCGFSGSHKTFIFGKAGEEIIQGYKVYTFQKEEVRSPYSHLLLAALLEGQSIFIRKETAVFLFHHKWKNFSQPANELRGSFNVRLEAARLISNNGEIKDQKELFKIFYSLFRENLIQHEINHDQVKKNFKDQEQMCLAEASAVFGKNILSQLGEVFADLGTFANIRQTRERGDTLRARQLLVLYLADNWFYGTGFDEDEVFSNLVFSLISPEGNIQPHKILEYENKFTQIADQIAALVKKAKFTLTNRPVSYAEIEVYVRQKIRESGQSLTDYEYLVSHWANIFHYLKVFAREAYQEVLALLKKKEELLVPQIDLSQFAGSFIQIKPSTPKIMLQGKQIAFEMAETLADFKLSDQLSALLKEKNPDIPLLTKCLNLLGAPQDEYVVGRVEEPAGVYKSLGEVPKAKEPFQVLIVSDNRLLIRSWRLENSKKQLRSNLDQAGFSGKCEISIFSETATAIRDLRKTKYNLIFLDSMVGCGSSFEVFKLLKLKSNNNIFLITDFNGPEPAEVKQLGVKSAPRTDMVPEKFASIIYDYVQFSK